MFDYLIALSTLSWLSFKVLADWASLANPSSNNSTQNNTSSNNNLVGRNKPQNNANRTEGNWDLGIGELSGKKSTFSHFFIFDYFHICIKIKYTQHMQGPTREISGPGIKFSIFKVLFFFGFMNL